MLPARGQPPLGRESSSVYRSFWQAGFDGADHVSGADQPLSPNDGSGHSRHAGDDYRRLGRFGIRTVRESAGWRCVEKRGRFDFSCVGHRAREAQQRNIQVLWTFMHFGVPKGLDLASPCFASRFADYCGALARFLKPFHGSGRRPVYTPINQISLLADAVGESASELGETVRSGSGLGRYELKKRLVQAALRGCDAIWAVEPAARILTVEPLVHTAAPHDRPDLHGLAQRQNLARCEVWDMLSGRLEPQLGGAPRYLDLMGVAHYPRYQREAGSNAALPWQPTDPRRRRLSTLLGDVHHRYGKSLTLAETGATGEDRAGWISDVGVELEMAEQAGIPVDGVCLYPVIDRPARCDASHWHRSGLWQVRESDPRLPRQLDRDYAASLKRAQARLEQIATPSTGGRRTRTN
ncbi:MAG: hypothetical protein M3Q40_08580 [Pseudomonadota bacterium]|nr:hypothetical protein [Pseudomonadota bacterium]